MALRLAQLARLTSIRHVAGLETAWAIFFTGHAGAVGIARIISWFQTTSARSQLRFASKVLVLHLVFEPAGYIPVLKRYHQRSSIEAHILSDIP